MQVISGRLKMSWIDIRACIRVVVFVGGAAMLASWLAAPDAKFDNLELAETK